MKKIRLTFILFFTFLIINRFAYPVKVQAVTYPTFSHDWEWNYNGAAYYYIVDLSSSFTTAVNQAATNWFKTGYHTNPLYPMTRTYIKSNSPMDFYNEVIGEDYARLCSLFCTGWNRTFI